MTEFTPYYRLTEEDEVYKVRPDSEYWQGFSKFLGVDKFIEEIRVPQEGPLDINATAEAIDIPVYIDETIRNHAVISGLHDKDSPIEIRISEFSNEKTLSFAHEVGHFLLYLEGHNNKYTYNIEESFCEYFGRKLSMPNVDGLIIEDISGELLEDLSKEYQVRVSSLAIWLMEKGVFPEQLIIDTRNPASDNPDYSQKVTRHILCLKCEYGICEDRGIQYEGESIPLLDLTSHELGKSFGNGHAPRIKAGDHSFKALQTKYNRNI